MLTIESDWKRDKIGVFLKDRLDACILAEFLHTLFEVDNDAAAPLSICIVRDAISTGAIGGPSLALITVFPGMGVHVYIVRGHEC